MKCGMYIVQRSNALTKQATSQPTMINLQGDKPAVILHTKLRGLVVKREHTFVLTVCESVGNHRCGTARWCRPGRTRQLSDERQRRRQRNGLPHFIPTPVHCTVSRVPPLLSCINLSTF